MLNDVYYIHYLDSIIKRTSAWPMMIVHNTSNMCLPTSFDNELRAWSNTGCPKKNYTQF